MRILIIEDEKSNADRLCRLLREINEVQTEVVAVASSNAEAIQCLENMQHGIDLILADIQLGDGLSFEALSHINGNIPVVFTTAYDQYAINAFNYNGIAYLLKPIDRQELLCALQKVEQQPVGDSLQSIISALHNGELRYRERFLISFRDEMKVIHASDVSHIGLVEGSTIIYTTTGKQYHLAQTLEELESQLNPQHFMRINRQYIANINSVESLVAHFLGKMRLRLRHYPDTEIIISRAKVSQVKRWLDW